MPVVSCRNLVRLAVEFLGNRLIGETIVPRGSSLSFIRVETWKSEESSFFENQEIILVGRKLVLDFIVRLQP